MLRFYKIPLSRLVHSGKQKLSSYSPVHECVLQQWCDSIDVVFTHLSNVLKQEREGLEYTVLHIEFRHTVFVHECRQHCEW